LLPKIPSNVIEWGLVQLRQHPNWPPAWVRTNGTGDKYISGALGVLERTQTSLVDGKRCYITIRYQNSTHIGGVNFDDARICRKVCTFLGSYYGQPVEKIAQLEIPID